MADNLLLALAGALKGSTDVLVPYFKSRNENNLAKELYQYKTNLDATPIGRAEELSGQTTTLPRETMLKPNELNLLRPTSYFDYSSGSPVPVVTGRGNLRPLPRTPVTPEDREQAKYDAKLKASKPKARAAYRSAQEELNLMKRDVDALLSNPAKTGKVAGGTGWQSRFAWTDAAAVRAKIESLKAKTGFSALQEMRNTSPTGGALGNTSDRELALLQNKLAAIDTNQPDADLLNALRDLSVTLDSASKRVDKAFEETYDEAPPEWNFRSTVPPSAGSTDTGWSADDERRLQELEREAASGSRR